MTDIRCQRTEAEIRSRLTRHHNCSLSSDICHLSSVIWPCPLTEHCQFDMLNQRMFAMAVTQWAVPARAGVAAGILLLLLAPIGGASGADEKPYAMKVAIPTLDDAVHQYARNYAAAVEKDSAGRIKPE